MIGSCQIAFLSRRIDRTSRSLMSFNELQLAEEPLICISLSPSDAIMAVYSSRNNRQKYKRTGGKTALHRTSAYSAVRNRLLNIFS